MARASSVAQPSASLRGFVRQQLLEQLARNCEMGMRLPPISQLASQYGAAIGTVQLAVRDLVGAGVLLTRQKLGTTVAPSCNADRIRALLTEGTFEQRRASDERPDLVGKCVQVFSIARADRLIEDMAVRVVESMGKYSCTVQRVLCDRAVPLRLRAPDADAVIAIQPGHQFEPQLQPHQVLLVIATERVSVNATGRYDLVAIDDDHGSFLAGRRLKEAGCRHACFVGASDSRTARGTLGPTSVRRLRGFERGWGKELAPNCQWNARTYDIDSGERMATAFMAMSPRPDAVFAATDELAVGLIHGVRRHGLEPGRDFHIVGFDKQELALNLVGGPLTTVEVPRMQMAVRGARLIADRLTDPDQPIHRLYLGCSLFEGKTVGRP